MINAVRPLTRSQTIRLFSSARKPAVKEVVEFAQNRNVYRKEVSRLRKAYAGV